MNAKVFELLDACLDIFLDDYRPQGITGAEDIEEGFELWMQQQIEQFNRESSWDDAYACWQLEQGSKARLKKIEKQNQRFWLNSDNLYGYKMLKEMYPNHKKED